MTDSNLSVSRKQPQHLWTELSYIRTSESYKRYLHRGSPQQPFCAVRITARARRRGLYPRASGYDITLRLAATSNQSESLLEGTYDPFLANVYLPKCLDLPRPLTPMEGQTNSEPDDTNGAEESDCPFSDVFLFQGLKCM